MPYRILNMLLLWCVLPVWASAPAAAQPREPRFELNVERVDGAEGDKAYQVTSSGTVQATPALVWRVLTDYDHLADYLPNLKSTRVVSRTGGKVILEQVGAARFLFFSQTIRLVVQVDERTPDRIDIELIEGDMKAFRARWELSPLAGATGTTGTRVAYSATIVPKFDVPGIIGTSVVRKDIARMMAAVLSRVDRQQ